MIFTSNGLALLLGTLLAAACGSGAAASATPARKGTTDGKGRGRPGIIFPVEVLPALQARSRSTLKATGTIQANERIHVSAGLPGIVERVSFREGQIVGLNTVLAEIDPLRFELAVKSAEAELRQARSNRDEAVAANQRRRRASLAYPGLVASEELDSFRTKVQLSSERVTQAGLALQRAKLDQAKAYVRAPIAGIIQTKAVETGQYVQVGAPIAMLLRRDPLLLHFDVRERDAASLAPGMLVSFQTRSNERVWTGKITHVAQEADASARMVAVTAEVEVSDSGAELRPGTFVEVSVAVGSEDAVTLIPEFAVRASEFGFIVFVVENGVAKQRSVTLGPRTDDKQMQVKSGLAPGELVVLRGAQALRDGAPVKVVEEMPGTRENRPGALK